MNNKFKVITALAVVLVFSASACTSGGGKSLTSAEALKEYLDKQPANSPDKPIKVTMNANDLMIEKIVTAMNSAGKYVSLNLPGNALTTIPDGAFYDESTNKGCSTLVAITIPSSVTRIGESAFYGSALASVTIGNGLTSIGERAFELCGKLTSVKFEGTITSSNFHSSAFPGDLRAKYLAGGIGTYTRPKGSSTWTKQ